MRILLFLALAAVLGAAGSPVWAQAGNPRPILLTAAAMSMEQAVKMAEQRFKARVVRAESQQDNGRTIYVLRLLNESGRVWTVRVDASSGTLL